MPSPALDANANPNAALDPIPWPLEALWQAVEPTLPGFTCEMLPSVDSTNAELMRRFKNGQTEPILLLAEQQTAGRGRLGKRWLSARGDSLTFSIGMLLSPAAWSGLSLAVGVSLAESLDPAFSPDHHIALKWPNDLWLVHQVNQSGVRASGTQAPAIEQKLAGVLIETATWEGARYVVIGVGINIRAISLEDVPTSEMAAVPPGHLQQLYPQLDAAGTLLQILPSLMQTVQAFSEFGFEPFQERFARRDVLANREVTLSDNTVGKAHGVSADGGLLVYTASGMQVVASSEISIRPAPAPDLNFAKAARPGKTAESGESAKNVESMSRLAANEDISA